MNNNTHNDRDIAMRYTLSIIAIASIVLSFCTNTLTQAMIEQSNPVVKHAAPEAEAPVMLPSAKEAVQIPAPKPAEAKKPAAKKPAAKKPAAKKPAAKKPAAKKPAAKKPAAKKPAAKKPKTEDKSKEGA